MSSITQHQTADQSRRLGVNMQLSCLVEIELTSFSPWREQFGWLYLSYARVDFPVQIIISNSQFFFPPIKLQPSELTFPIMSPPHHHTKVSLRTKSPQPRSVKLWVSSWGSIYHYELQPSKTATSKLVVQQVLWNNPSVHKKYILLSWVNEELADWYLGRKHRWDSQTENAGWKKGRVSGDARRHKGSKNARGQVKKAMSQGVVYRLMRIG